jgi:hypothetical protein
MKLHLPSRSLPDGHMRLADCFLAVVLLQTDRLIGRQSCILVDPFSPLHHQCVAWMLSE